VLKPYIVQRKFDMARRSSNDLATRRAPRPDPKPPAPPPGLPLPAQRLWKAIVGAKPAGWFDDAALPTLAEYCRAAVACDRLAEAIEAELAAGGPIGGLKPLLDIRDKESRRLGALGSKLRLLPVSRYRPDSAAANRPAAGAPRPWHKPEGA
jgi:hypothetical protein